MSSPFHAGPGTGAERIAEIEARLEAATGCPWMHGAFGPGVDVSGEIRGGYVASCGMDGDTKHYVMPQLPEWKPSGAMADAEFIAYARQDIPWLIAELRASSDREAALNAATCAFCTARDIEHQVINGSRWCPSRIAEVVLSSSGEERTDG